MKSLAAKRLFRPDSVIFVKIKAQGFLGTDLHSFRRAEILSIYRKGNTGEMRQKCSCFWYEKQ